MPSFRSCFAGAALVLVAAQPAAAQEVGAGTVVATVGGQEITIGHMIVMLQGLPQQDQQLPDAELFEGILERLIQQAAVSQAATELSPGTELRLENERNALIASTVVDRLAKGIRVEDRAIQAAYDRRFANFTPVREYNASHILVETEEEAQAIVAELDGGADFAETAKLKSTGPSGPGGGALGWFGPGRMVPEFEAAVKALEVGQVSAPVQTQFGWHVILLNDSRLPEVPTVEQMRQELANEVWLDAMRAGIAEMVEAAGVDRRDVSGIDPSVLRDQDLVEF
ncbi:MAG: peptidylprolyl isomerase [Rhodobacter sp.]|nr:peptidylprolyl isomerase [Rhodobacter sp.]